MSCPQRRGIEVVLELLAETAPFIVLVDDCDHSADLLTRSLAAQGGPQVLHFAQPLRAEAALAAMLCSPDFDWPAFAVVDLKAHSGANVEFLERNRARFGQKGIPLVVMTQPTDRSRRQVLHEAGASAVFFRQADRDAYRHEVAGMISFWARSTRLDAVGM